MSDQIDPADLTTVRLHPLSEPYVSKRGSGEPVEPKNQVAMYSWPRLPLFSAERDDDVDGGGEEPVEIPVPSASTADSAAASCSAAAAAGGGLSTSPKLALLQISTPARETMTADTPRTRSALRGVGDGELLQPAGSFRTLRLGWDLLNGALVGTGLFNEYRTPDYASPNIEAGIEEMTLMRIDFPTDVRTLNDNVPPA